MCFDNLSGEVLLVSQQIVGGLDDIISKDTIQYFKGIMSVVHYIAYS